MENSDHQVAANKESDTWLVYVDGSSAQTRNYWVFEESYDRNKLAIDKIKNLSG